MDIKRFSFCDKQINALIFSKTPEGSLYKKAADYFLRDKDSFLLFTRDGRAPLHNQEAERTVKPYALARRSFLFVRGKTGGDCSAVAMTMIQNAYLNGIEPMSYLELLLADAYRGNSGDLPWLKETGDRIAALLASKEAEGKGTPSSDAQFSG